MSEQHPLPTTQQHSRRWLLLATVTIGLFLITLDNTVLYTALPTIVDELGATGSEMLWILNAYPVVITGLLLGSGTLGDKIGHRKMFIVGLIIFGIASAIGGSADSVASLITARAFLATGGAAMMPATLSLIRHTFEDEKEMNLAFGIWAAVSTVAAALGPLVGGLILEFLHWGFVFYMNIPFVILALATLPFVSKADEPNPAKTWDLLSSIYAMGFLTSMVLVVKELANRPPNWMIISIAVLISGASGYLFHRRQHRISQPLLTFDIFRIPSFLAGSLGASLSLFAVVGFQFLTTQRLQLIDRFSPLHAGAYVAVVALGSMVVSILAGKNLHRIGLRPLISGGMALGAVGSLIIAISSFTASVIRSIWESLDPFAENASCISIVRHSCRAVSSPRRRNGPARCRPLAPASSVRSTSKKAAPIDTGVISGVSAMQRHYRGCPVNEQRVSA